MSKGSEHAYTTRIVWTGNQGSGTSGYKAYGRDYDVLVDGRPVIKGSAAPAFRGDPSRHNPEDLLVASLSSCHMLWYLHLAAEAGVTVQAYVDVAEGRMTVAGGGGGHFTEVVLRPKVTVPAGSDLALVESLHHRAHELCFIANSVCFPVRCEPQTEAVG
ncbi:MAG: OsmC family protein [Ectothiorhodospiraceae bacterium]|nr:OsmC family protein [Ectothiorhodospiraceae bacterium]